MLLTWTGRSRAFDPLYLLQLAVVLDKIRVRFLEDYQGFVSQQFHVDDLIADDVPGVRAQILPILELQNLESEAADKNP